MLDHLLTDDDKDALAACRNSTIHYHVLESKDGKLAILEHRNETFALRSDEICGCAECRGQIDVPFHVEKAVRVILRVFWKKLLELHAVFRRG